MNVLVINCGSSSLKYQLFNMEDQSVLCSGMVERIGEEVGALSYKKLPDTADEAKTSLDEPMPNHEVALRKVIELITSGDTAVVADASEIECIGHRVVHGGEAFHASTLVDDKVLDAIRANIDLAPLHNPANLTGIEVAMSLFPGVDQVAVFDTAFHQTMPAEAYMYAIPYELYEELKIRRYGFHGTSHKFVAREAAKMLGKAEEDTNVITIHLGNGGSISAVKNGKCIDTTMGLTPLAGVMMGTRCGDIDAAVIPFLSEVKGMSIKEIDSLLNKESGLKGICGMNDMRDIHGAVEKGDEKAKLALDMMTYRNKKFVGSYMAALGRVDALVFTAGIGENDDIVRAMTLEGLENLGVVVDANANAGRVKEPKDVTGEGGSVRVLVIPTNEELEIATQTVEVISSQQR